MSDRGKLTEEMTGWVAGRSEKVGEKEGAVSCLFTLAVCLPREGPAPLPEC